MINYENHVKGRFLANILGKIECIVTGIVLLVFFCYFSYLVINNVVIERLFNKPSVEINWFLYAWTAFVLMIISAYYIIQAIIMIKCYSVTISIVDKGIKYRCLIITRVIPWEEFDYITLKKETTKNGSDTTMVCKLHDRTRGANPRFWKNVFLYIYPNDLFIKDLNNLSISIYNDITQK